MEPSERWRRPWLPHGECSKSEATHDRPDPPGRYNLPMARYTLVYGVRLIPEGTLKGMNDGTLTLANGSNAGVTLHTIDGTIPQLRRALDRSLDAFFDLLPGADEEDLEKFGD